jgi:tetratricopeptide (TPR) repeat protein
MVERQLRENIQSHGPLVSQEKMLAYTLFLMASVLANPADAPRALAMLDEARDIYSRILYFGVNDELSANLLVVQAARANALASLGRFSEARATAQDLLRSRRIRLADQPANHARQREVATALRRVGEVELIAGQPAAACSAFAEAGAIWDDMQRRGTLLGFDLAPPSGQVPWIRQQLAHCKGS